MTQTNPTDAVAQARERVELYFAHHRAGKELRSASVLADIESLALDALIAAVRAECADRVRGLHDALVTVAEIQERGPDTTIARVHQAYDMRCVARQSLAALEAQ